MLSSPALSPRSLPPTMVAGQPPTALAPMQDVTTLPFMRIIGRYGAPDYLFTEYFRVHAHSRLEPHIVDSILRHDTGRPIFAQIIGEDIPSIERSIDALRELPIAGIDLNLGCPAPKVYKKNVGGGLLRDPARIAAILAAMRARIPGRFTVKMRLGFDNTDAYPRILDAIAANGVDLLTIHGRTVAGSYRSEVDYAKIGEAVRRLDCPVLANGAISSSGVALRVLAETGAAGVMIGRAAIRNPWIFRQIRERLAGETVIQPTLSDVRGCVDFLLMMHDRPNLPGRNRLGLMKKFLSFVSLGVDPNGNFQYKMRRCRSLRDLLDCCDDFMLDGDRATAPFPEDAHDGLIARPNCEA